MSLAEHTHLSVTFSNLLVLHVIMFVYLSRMAFSSITEFSGSRGVNTWGAVWPGLLWGLQWVKLGQDVVAGQSLQLQTPLTLFTSWNSHITFSVPQNRSN